jgi:DNA polymerase III subunit delta'
VDVPDWHSAPFRRLVSVKGNLPHALLLSGPPGIGKLAFARALAQALLCESPAADGSACGTCNACAWFEGGSHPDFRQVEPEPADKDDEEGARKTTIGVEQIRALADFINMSSHRGGAKTIVVHPAETLNVNAANALLKSLEEPPPGTFFLLVSHRPHHLLPTIRSRCQQIALSAPDAAAATAWLAGQGVRDAGLALAHMGNAPLLALELERTGYWGARTAFLNQLARADIDIFAAAQAAEGCPIAHVIAWLQKWSYDMAHHRALGRVRYNPDYAEAIAKASNAADPLAVLRFHREMVKLQRNAQHPLNARLFVEDVVLAYRDIFEQRTVAA